uniref:Putative ovule protein n=1 Tax=Solanum chacoense TaxID=4108 RepID=A0A0V0H4N7_SOLCH
MPETKCLATNLPCDSLTRAKRSSDSLIVVITFLLANMFRVSIVLLQSILQMGFSRIELLLALV